MISRIKLGNMLTCPRVLLFLIKEDLYFSSSTYNLILQEKKNKTIHQNIQKGFLYLIPISKILEI